MRMLFICSAKSSAYRKSYPHRIVQLERHCRKLGADASLLFLGDLFFASPTLIQPLSFPFVLRQIREFDVIHAGGSGGAYFVAAIKSFLRQGTLVVYDVHGDAIAESRLQAKGLLDLVGHFNAFQMRFAEYFGVKSADCFITATSRLKQRLLARNNNIEGDNVEVILNGVNIDSFKPLKDKIAHENKFTVTYAGSFYKYQGINNLIQAAENLTREDILFKFIGFRSGDSKIKEQIRDKLGKKALLLDWLPKTDLQEELQKSDVLIIPADASTREQAENRVLAFPTKFAEFLALAKPVIVTRIDETSKIVERFDCGFVCEPTAESIAETIRKAKETPQKTLVLKGLNGRRFAEAELDINLICKKYLKFLSRILEKRSSRNRYI